MRISRFPICSSSNRTLKAPRIRRRYPQISQRLGTPLFGRPGCWRQEMRDRQARAQHRPIATIEEEERERRVIVKRLQDAGADVVANSFRAEMLAFKIEVSNLLKGIEGSQPRIEL